MGMLKLHKQKLRKEHEFDKKLWTYNSSLVLAVVLQSNLALVTYSSQQTKHTYVTPIWYRNCHGKIQQYLFKILLDNSCNIKRLIPWAHWPIFWMPCWRPVILEKFEWRSDCANRARSRAPSTVMLGSTGWWHRWWGWCLLIYANKVGQYRS